MHFQIILYVLEGIYLDISSDIFPRPKSWFWFAYKIVIEVILNVQRQGARKLKKPLKKYC